LRIVIKFLDSDAQQDSSILAREQAPSLPQEYAPSGVRKPKFLDGKKPTIWEYPDSEYLSKALCGEVRSHAINAIKQKGSFNLCIPGGSALKLLSGLKDVEGVDWSKVKLFYINHKCVLNNNPSATHFKAKICFLMPSVLQMFSSWKVLQMAPL